MKREMEDVDADGPLQVIQPEDSTFIPAQFTVLVIDDDSDQRDLITTLVAYQGYQVISAESSEEALRIMHCRHIDLVVSDVMMPGMNGLDLVKSLRSITMIPSQSHLPIILITAGRDDLESDCMTQGADSFCPKRSVPQLLLGKIRVLLEQAPP